MDREELTKRYELATSEVYAQIRKRVLDFIVKQARGNQEDINIRGMLLVIGEIDKWVGDYYTELKRRKEE